jgi:hypothetical protein
MKKYKLLQWYPPLGDLLKVGDIISSSLVKESYSAYCGLFKLGIEEVENNPLFWELQAEFLFTSEEGLPVFKGDCVWVPRTHNGSIIRFDAEYTSNIEGFKYFAKKENAEKFLEKFNRAYSLDEIVKAVNNWSMCGVEKECIINFLNDEN